ncbi:hypothetical protein [Prosthecobacter sp.]|uniref:hypothetical protein n=1 Tax=Prosthecobacter sp. TaxID=1965333 RepID=UPI00378334E1
MLMNGLPSILAIGPVGNMELLIIFALGLVLALVQVVPFWFICKKTGMSPWLSLITLIPLGVLILSFVLAFGEWPALKRNGPPGI